MQCLLKEFGNCWERTNTKTEPMQVTRVDDWFDPCSKANRFWMIAQGKSMDGQAADLR